MKTFWVVVAVVVGLAVGALLLRGGPGPRPIPIGDPTRIAIEPAASRPPVVQPEPHPVSTPGPVPPAAKPVDPISPEAAPADVMPAEVKPEGVKPEDLKPQEIKPAQTHPELTKPEEVKPVDPPAPSPTPSEAPKPPVEAPKAEPAETVKPESAPQAQPPAAPPAAPPTEAPTEAPAPASSVRPEAVTPPSDAPPRVPEVKSDVPPAPGPAAAKPSDAPPVDGPPVIERREDGSMLVDGKYEVKGDGSAERPYEVTWEMLISAQETYQPKEGKKLIPGRLAMLDNKHVKITGYIAFPLYVQEAREMLSMLNQWDGCCIGVPPTPYDAIEVRLKEAVTGPERFATFGSVEGRFGVKPYVVGDWLVGLYTLDDAKFDAKVFSGS